MTKGSNESDASDDRMSVEDAAVLMGVSVTMLLHRMGQGDVPFETAKSRHSLKESDVRTFKEEEDRRRRAAAEFGEQTDELDSTYSSSPTNIG